MNFYVNEILQDCQQESLYRILWIDSRNVIMYIEKFIKMIQAFQREYRQYSVSLNFVYLPKGRKFSYIVAEIRRMNSCNSKNW